MNDKLLLSLIAVYAVVSIGLMAFNIVM